MANVARVEGEATEMFRLKPPISRAETQAPKTRDIEPRFARDID